MAIQQVMTDGAPTLPAGWFEVSLASAPACPKGASFVSASGEILRVEVGTGFKVDATGALVPATILQSGDVVVADLRFAPHSSGGSLAIVANGSTIASANLVADAQPSEFATQQITGTYVVSDSDAGKVVVVVTVDGPAALSDCELAAWANRPGPGAAPW